MLGKPRPWFARMICVTMNPAFVPYVTLNQMMEMSSWQEYSDPRPHRHGASLMFLTIACTTPDQMEYRYYN